MSEGRRTPKKARIEVALACTVCRTRNYKTTKPQREGVGVLRLSKFCSTCNRHTEHIESR